MLESFRGRLADRNRSVAFVNRVEMLLSLSRDSLSRSVKLRPREWCPLPEGTGGAARTGTHVSTSVATGACCSSSSTTISIIPVPSAPAPGCIKCGNGAGGGGGGIARCCSSLSMGGGGGGGGILSSWDALRYSFMLLSPSISSMPRISPVDPFSIEWPRECVRPWLLPAGGGISDLRRPKGSSGMGADILRGIIGLVGGW